MASGFRAWTAGWKFVCATIASIPVAIPLSRAAQSSADEQVQAVFGIPPWNELTGAPGVGFVNYGTIGCLEGRGFSKGADVYAASQQGAVRYFGLSGQQWFRSDLGVDSYGGAPPSGEAAHPPNGIEVPRCSAFIATGAGNQLGCQLWGFNHQIPAPIAQDQYIKTTLGTPVSINLVKGYIGALPTSAALAVYAPIGGTVTGLPNTTVTFTPFFPAYFQLAQTRKTTFSNRLL